MGHTGYLRESNYFYAPLGVICKLYLTEESKLITTLEFDGLLIGKQISDGVTNTQKSGYGARTSLMYQRNHWSIGPYVIYWHINDSDVVGIHEVREPKNYTVETGLKLSYRF